jgi:hypothetical protein
VTRRQGQWNAYVEAGKTREQQGERYKEAPEEFQSGIASHMRVIDAVKAHVAKIKAERERNKLKRR